MPILFFSFVVDEMLQSSFNTDARLSGYQYQPPCHCPVELESATVDQHRDNIDFDHSIDAWHKKGPAEPMLLV